MIEYRRGNILDEGTGIICQQVNCQGVMGAGLAKQIRDKYPEVYNVYKEYIFKRKVNCLDGVKLLGSVNPVYINKNLIIANIFAQWDYGTNRIQTDYESLKEGLEYIEKTVAPVYNLPVYIPYGIGCGLAGGDWETVEFIIKMIFKDSRVQCIIVKRD